ncbi:NAD(P)/FAD-dependent oxidoreductase [Emticicia sp. BO119]|uniref:NAD(P)/FAD-dependent oxidoreductase n=1 Tax=Emticicia sp. BO119 TaxID=2757768 RepID=UPI0015F04130|nr:NAD(P)/FAD-dependent oxidoreductase [Emticicia sp. BO119]MBA4853801.1 NAD(P)/FAD-dependent oxidoreductase [Emticicia sp. BO119]
MSNNQEFEVIVIGGSYAGLSAAMSLGRALRKVLVIDGGYPCNQQTPHSHNFLTQDGQKPKEIANIALEQIAQYKTVEFYKGLVTNATKTEDGFKVEIQNDEFFYTKKLVLATGLKDILPEIDGFAECWGISIVHCPYCHGYEIHHKKTGIIANGDAAFHYAQLINNWTKDLIIFTNSASTLSEEQLATLKKHQINIIETPIKRLIHREGKIEKIALTDGLSFILDAIYSRPVSVQHSIIPESLGCELTDHGLLKINNSQKTNISGVFACGDNSNPMRSVAMAVASGSATGAFVNHELISEKF